MEQLNKYRSLLGTSEPIDKNNINNYKLGINNIDSESYEIILGLDLDIYKVDIKDIKLSGILKEYPSIIRKFISEKIYEKCSLSSFIEISNFNKEYIDDMVFDTMSIKMNIKTKYFFEHLEFTLTKLSDSYFQKQINDIKFKEIVLEEYVLTDDDKKTYLELHGKSKKTEEEEEIYRKIEKNIGMKYPNVFSEQDVYNKTLIKKQGFKLIYNCDKIYFQGVIDDFIDISFYQKLDSRHFKSVYDIWYFYNIKNKKIDYDLSKHDGLIKKYILFVNRNYENYNLKMFYKKYKLPFSFRKLIVKNFCKFINSYSFNAVVNTTNGLSNNSYTIIYTIILDNDNLIILTSPHPKQLNTSLELNDEFILLT
ncbi:MAG: hypothetical protein CMF62_04250 [Magnetococcales bacterium]|nr:hypothetical protein [Magnetococcales bacterium]|tara:strand:- start:1940 stop:3037 length:1098 start_codon:yes stop_codon:yes gene_type:complete